MSMITGNGATANVSKYKIGVGLVTLLRIGMVVTGRKPLWSRATGPSLLLYRDSGSTVVTDRNRPSLLCAVAAMDIVTSFAHHYCGI
jgi:hypothetical protein